MNTRTILITKVNTRATLMSKIKLAAKNVMMKLNGSFSEYDPIRRSIPKIVKNRQMTIRPICRHHQAYFIYPRILQIAPVKAFRYHIMFENSCTSFNHAEVVLWVNFGQAEEVPRHLPMA